MSDSTQARMVGWEHSYHVHDWTKSYFIVHSRAKIKQTKVQLQTIKKGTLCIYEYLKQIKDAIDTLDFVGFKLSTSEYVDYILDGLPGEYDAFVTSVLTRKDDYTIVEIESLLLAQESRIEKSIGGSMNIVTNGYNI